MNTFTQIQEPILFNPLKHHLDFIREFINLNTHYRTEADLTNVTRELKHLGSSVMDVYSGSLPVFNICIEIKELLEQKSCLKREFFTKWTGINNLRIISLSDGSQWTLKYHENENRYLHIFPARNSQHTFRIKANTLKSAILYNITSGKDYITADALNKVRSLLGMSPIKDPVDTEAISEMIEILRN
jgi:hypothetical protein